MLAEYEVGKDIEVGVKKLMVGQTSQAEYDNFIAEYNKKLYKIAAEKKKKEEEKRSVEFWEKYNSTCYY
jgi:hypothetical protein